MTTTKKLLRLIYSILLLCILTFGGYILVQSSNIWENTFSEAEPTDIETIPESTGDDFVSVLLLGLDENDMKEGRADVIMFTLINLKTGTIKAVSIPRDTRIILDNKQPDKLNHAYTYSPEIAMNSVEQILKFPVDYYLALNFEAFRKAIDLIGGIKINVEKEIPFNGSKIGKGPQKMDGKLTLKYVRFRDDNEGDFGRMRRQQQVLNAILRKVVNMETLTNISDFFELAEENIRHNIPSEDVFDNAPELSKIVNGKFTQKRLKGEITKIDSLWYVELDSTHLRAVRNNLRTAHSSSR